MSELSIQETYYPDLMCFGCGHANHKGLKLRSYEQDGMVVARFTPWPEHNNGGGFLNGGIIATLLDCHGAAAVLLESERRGLGTGGLSFVTAKIDVEYHRAVGNLSHGPTPSPPAIGGRSRSGCRGGAARHATADCAHTPRGG